MHEWTGLSSTSNSLTDIHDLTSLLLHVSYIVGITSRDIASATIAADSLLLSPVEINKSSRAIMTINVVMLQHMISIVGTQPATVQGSGTEIPVSEKQERAGV